MSLLVEREPDAELDELAYSERYLTTVAAFARGLLTHHPPTSPHEARRLHAWCDELEDAAIVLGSQPAGSATPLHSVSARF
jgi:hypothetical protein